MSGFTSIIRAASAAALVTAIAGSATIPASAQALTVVRVDALPTDNSGNIYFALELGYFKNAGLDVQLQAPMQNGSASAAALVSGALDVAQSNIAAISAAHLRGIDLKFFAPAAAISDRTVTDGVMVPKDSTATTAADLNGKLIAIIAVKSVQQVLAMSWVDKHGGDSKTLKFVELPYPQMGAALAAHRIDAAIVTEPFLTQAKIGARVIGNADDGVAPRFIGLAWTATTAWLQSHADVAARFNAAVRQGGLWANDHPSESADILIKYSHFDPATMHAMGRTTYLSALEPGLIQPVIDASVKYGVLDRHLAASELIWTAPK